MLDRITKFISSGLNSLGKDHDCASFAHAANGISYTFADFDPNKWNFSSFSDSDIKAGDTILITGEPEITSQDFKHFAIYLADGLYLSKFGETGNLIVNDLPSLKKLFDGDNIHLAAPKPEFVTN